ncbi:MAG: hypothetical protein ACLQBD_05970 [Syntrophobacteraceae bacterium]
MDKLQTITLSKKISLARLIVVELVIITFALSGCASAPAINKDIQAFSQSVTITTSNTTAAFEMVDSNYYQLQVAKLVNNYDEKGFNPKTVTRFLSSNELEIRLQALKAVATYATKIADIMSDNTLNEFDTQTKSFGEALLKLRGNDSLKKFAPSENDLKIFTTAVDTLGHWFIDYKRQKGLKVIVNDMNEPVQGICKLLVADIGALPDKDGKGGHGLRDQLHNQYISLIQNQDEFIEKNKGKLDPRSRRDEIARLPELVREQETADATLAATQKAVNKLAETHKELVRSFDSPSPKIRRAY